MNIVKLMFVSCVITITSCNHKKETMSFARDVFGFDLPPGVELVKNDKDFNYNPTGDGEKTVVFSFTNHELLRELCISGDMKKMPIDENDLPDGTIYKYIDRKDTSGYYKLNIDNTDNQSYSIGVVDFGSEKIYIYEAFY